MLLTLLLWIYVSVLTFLAGDMLLRGVRRWVTPVPMLAAPLVCLCGAAGLTVALGWVWLLLPIDRLTHGLLAILLIGYGLWVRPVPVASLPRWTITWLGWLTVGILFMIVWLRTGQLPRLVDTGGYHAPMIEWIHQYAVVPGLANLNYRFGFNNTWFLPSAFFRFQLAPAVPWHGLNGWLMGMLGWFSLTEWHRWFQSRQTLFSAWLGGWLAVGFLLIFHWTLSSPSPDLPTHVYVALCFWAWLRRAEPDQRQFAKGWVVLLLLFSLLALTTKLSAVTVLVLPGIVALQLLVRGRWQQLLPLVVVTVVATGYWWVSTVVLSGYVAYPSLSPLVDWFGVDWKVPGASIAVGLRNLQEGTRGDAGSVFSLAWVPYWLKTRPALEQLIFVILLAAPGLVLLYRKGVYATIPGYGVALATAWLGVVFWFLLAPEIRFGAGSVLVALLLSYGPVMIRLTSRSARAQWLSLVAVEVIGLGLVVAAVRREPVHWLMPAGYPAGLLSRYKSGSHIVLYPVDDRRVINGIRGYWGNCYDAGLPCSPYPMPGLTWRGQRLQNGFRTDASNKE